MDLNLFGYKTLIIADNCYYQLLFKFKNENPNLNIKIMNKSDIVSRLSFSYKKDPLPYLISQCHIEYSKAKKYMELIRISEVSNNTKLQNLYNKLKDNDYLEFNDLGKYELSRFDKVLIFNSCNDLELQNLLNRNDIEFKCIDFSSLDFVEQDSFLNPNVLYFNNKFNQYFYIFSDIKRLLLENPNLKDNIVVLVDDGPGDYFYLSTISNIFNLPILTNVISPLITDKNVKKAVSEIYIKKTLDIELDLENENVKYLSDLIEHYCLKDISDFEEAYANLLEIISSNNISTTSNVKGIKVTSKFNFIPNYIYYVTNFRHGSFFNEFADNNVLTDIELEQVSSNASYHKTLMDKEKKLSFIKYNNIALFSRVKQHLTDSIYDSQFINELSWSKYIKTAEYNENGIYTKSASELINADKFDKSFLRKEYEKIVPPFNPTYKKITGNIKFTNDYDEYSITSLEKYISCPFKFYLEKLIPQTDDDRHSRWRGTLLHSIVEDIYHDDYDFETSFARGVNSYKESVNRDGCVFGPKEEAYIEIIHYWAKQVLPLIRKQVSSDNGMNWINNKNDSELKIRFTLEDELGNVFKFKGSIDKIIWTKGDSKEYYTIVDFKSGLERFSPESVFLGSSTQLPMYYYALNQENNKKYIEDKTFGGFVIKPSFAGSIGSILKDKTSANKDSLSEAAGLKFLRMQGLTTSSLDYWKSIDASSKNYKDNKLQTYGGTFVKNELLFTTVDDNDNRIVLTSMDHYNFNDLINDAKKATLNTIKKILNNEFDIIPTSFDLKKFDKNKLACSRCPYGNICYRNRDWAHDYKEEIHEHFFPENVEDEEVGGEA